MAEVKNFPKELGKVEEVVETESKNISESAKKRVADMYNEIAGLQNAMQQFIFGMSEAFGLDAEWVFDYRSLQFVKKPKAKGK